MQPLIDAMESLLSGGLNITALAVLALFCLLLVVFNGRAKRGHRFPVRAISAYKSIHQLVSRSLESGQPIHVGMGSGRVGTEAMPEALMGLTVFDYVARHAAAYDQAVLGTTADGTILSAAQGVLQRAREEAGFAERYAGKELRFYGPDPLVYAAGTAGAITRDQHLANILVGRFGHEGLWIGEAAQGQDMVQLGGAVSPSAIALMQATLDECVIGEEVFAAGAYLHRRSHLGSLATQDTMRILAILAIIASVVMASLGYLG